jgi:hypothetical protein
MQTKEQKKRAQQKRAQKKQERRNRYKENRKRRNLEQQESCRLIFNLYKCIMHHFPELFERLETVPECRKQPHYKMVEILMAGVVLFVFKKGSRNKMNAEYREPKFRRNYERLFKVRLPHMDTVEDVLRVLEERHLEVLKVELVQCLLLKKRFRQFRLFGEYYEVVIDATHVIDVEKGHCEHCLHQELKNGKIRYFHNVVEAKLVCSNGFCISLATEWIENQENYKKQDCEFKSFKRLAAKLKTHYPRLKVCIVADGLYPNQSFFGICEANGWQWIVTFQDGNLPTVWGALIVRQGLERCRSRNEEFEKGGKRGTCRYEWVNNLEYEGFKLHWLECRERLGDKRKRFVYLSSFEVGYANVRELTAAGRRRWKIENEGFDVQKNHGYGLGHKFSRRSMLAMKNYYQLMQIGHMMNQLFELGSLLTDSRWAKESLIQVRDVLLGELRHEELDFGFLEVLLSRRIRIGYD